MDVWGKRAHKQLTNNLLMIPSLDDNVGDTTPLL